MYKQILILVFIVSHFFLNAEGTKELQPLVANDAYLEFNPVVSSGVNMGLYTPNTATYPSAGGEADYRLNVRICSAGERIYFGARRTGGPVYARLKDPTGAVVAGPALLPLAGGYPSYASGPAPVVGGFGYAPDIIYVTAMAGDYYMEFNSTPAAYSPANCLIRYFDITVASPSNIAIPGRLWSKAWYLTTNSGIGTFSGKMFMYSPDGIVSSIQFNNMQPYGFPVICNSHGLVNTANFPSDRRSQVGLFTSFPEYPIFVNNPDVNCFPTGTFGNILGSPSITGCTFPKCINVTVDKAGIAKIVLDLNGVAGYQVGTSDRLFEENVVLGANCISWDGLDGLGNPVLPGATVNLEVSYQNSIFNLPLFDIEENPNGFVISLIRPAGPAPLLYWDDASIVAGIPIDGISNFTGCNTALPGCHRWTGRGNNGCVPGCPETINTWWYSSTSSQAIANIPVEVIVDANSLTVGTGQTNNSKDFCISFGTDLQDASFSAPPGHSISWTNFGDGVFDDASIVDPVYTPGPTDIANGFVKLLLEAFGPCYDKDSLILNIFQQPDIILSADTNFCNSNSSITFDATLSSNVSSYSWSNGLGTFTPDNFSVSGTYSFDASDIGSGSVSLVCTGVSNAVCPSDDDTIVVNLFAPIAISSGGVVSSCSNLDSVQLAGTLSGPPDLAYFWDRITVDGTFDNTTILNPYYRFGTGDVASGIAAVRLNAFSTICPNRRDTTIILLTNAVPAVINVDTTLCDNTPVVNLEITSGGSTVISWDANGTGMFSSGSSAVTTYLPSVADIVSGTIQIVGTSTTPLCNPERDTMIVTLYPAAALNAGSDINTCADRDSIAISATFTAHPMYTFNWSPVTDGAVYDSLNANAYYEFGPTDISSGAAIVEFVATSALCPTVADAAQITIHAAPTIVLNADTTICNLLPQVDLRAIGSANITAYSWLNTDGIYSGTNLSGGVYSAIYTPSSAETATGFATMVVQGNAPFCNPVRDTMLVTLYSAANLDAYASTAAKGLPANEYLLCPNPASTTLNGTITIPSVYTAIWTSLGDGILTAPNSPTAGYQYGSNDTISGSVRLVLTATSALCPTVSDTAQITFISSNLNAGNDTLVCDNSTSIPLNAVNGGFSVLAWTSNGLGSFSAASSYATNYQFATSDTALAPLYLFFDVSSPCGSLSDTVEVSFNPAPIANAGPDQVTGSTGNTVAFDASLSTAGPTITYLWSSGDMNIANASGIQTNATINTLPASATLTVTNSVNGCSSSDVVLVRAIEIEIPNIFSPNADGTNDEFRIKNIEFFPNATLKIYDQWSNMVFSASPANAYFWDGKSGGSDIPEATYYYVLDLNVPDVKEIKGNVTIVR